MDSDIYDRFYRAAAFRSIQSEQCLLIDAQIAYPLLNAFLVPQRIVSYSLFWSGLLCQDHAHSLTFVLNLSKYHGMRI